MKSKDKFKPHTMYDKQGKAYKANTYEQHLAMKKKGYGHDKPAAKKKTAKKKTAKKKAKSFTEAVESRMGGGY